MQYLSIFSANGGKYGPEITPYLDVFHAVLRKLYSIVKKIIFASCKDDIEPCMMILITNLFTKIKLSML